MLRGQNKNLILESGKALIYKQGYHATGVAQIANEAGVPKGSFFNYFSSKETFAVEIIEYYTTNVVTYLTEKLLNGKQKYYIDSLRNLYKVWSRDHLKVYEGKGCLSANLTQEMAIQNIPVQMALKDSFTRLKEPFYKCLVLAQRNDELDQTLDIKILTSSIYNGWQGAQLNAKAMNSNEPLEEFRLNTFEKLIT